MPKLSRRRRQLKEILRNNRDGDTAGSVGESDSVGSESKRENKKMNKRAAPRSNSDGASENNDEEDVDDGETEDEKVWVQCNECDKWRSLPKHIESSSLPELWVCSMNHWNPELAKCEAVEETYSSTDDKLRSFVQVWSKRLKNAEKAESRLPPSAVTRGRKKRADVDWIKCCSPSCGKWRAITIRGLDYVNMFQKLNSSGGWKSKDTLWYCSMNTWDETTASCAAPQEPLYDAPWNLENVPIVVTMPP